MISSRSLKTENSKAENIENGKNNHFPDNLPPKWRELLKGEAEEPYFKDLTRFLQSEYRTKKIIFPPRERVLRALQSVDYDEVKVVILGQDPYHGPDQAIGLSFAVPNELRPKPPSLTNIFKEIATDCKCEMNSSLSDLSGWAEQGVLLLNTVLTVRRAEAFSHRNRGWETFTNKIIEHLSSREDPLVFILWGAAAQAKKALIDTKRHFILESPHPSPLSAHRGFFGSKPFSKTNEILEKKLHKDPIQWNKICSNAST